MVFTCQEPSLEESSCQVLLVCHGRKTLRQAAQQEGERCSGRRSLKLLSQLTALCTARCWLAYISVEAARRPLRMMTAPSSTHLLSLHLSAVRWGRRLDTLNRKKMEVSRLMCPNLSSTGGNILRTFFPFPVASPVDWAPLAHGSN